MQTEKKRARTDTAKAERRAAILDAAREAMLEDGYDAVTMAELARRVGLAKGTLYLYFKTKEELFLWLYVDLLEDVTDALEEAFSSPVSDEDFIAEMIKAVTESPLFLSMTARLTSVIEINTSIDALVASKREMMALYPRIAAATERALGLEEGEGLSVARAIHVMMAGASLSNVATANLEKDLPDDVRALIASASFADVFPDSLALIIKGARA